MSELLEIMLDHLGNSSYLFANLITEMKDVSNQSCKATIGTSTISTRIDMPFDIKDLAFLRYDINSTSNDDYVVFRDCKACFVAPQDQYFLINTNQDSAKHLFSTYTSADDKSSHGVGGGQYLKFALDNDGSWNLAFRFSSLTREGDQWYNTYKNDDVTVVIAQNERNTNFDDITIHYNANENNNYRQLDEAFTVWEGDNLSIGENSESHTFDVTYSNYS